MRPALWAPRIQLSAGSRRALAQGYLWRPTLAGEPRVRFRVTKVDARFTGRAEDPSGEPKVEAVPPRASQGERAPHRRSGGPSQLQADAADHRPSRPPLPSSLLRTPTEPSIQGLHLGSYSSGTTSARGAPTATHPGYARTRRSHCPRCRATGGKAEPRTG